MCECIFVKLASIIIHLNGTIKGKGLMEERLSDVSLKGFNMAEPILAFQTRFVVDY